MTNQNHWLEILSSSRRAKRQKMVKDLAAVRLEGGTPVKVWQQRKTGPPKKKK